MSDDTTWTCEIYWEGEVVATVTEDSDGLDMVVVKECSLPTDKARELARAIAKMADVIDAREAGPK